MRQNKELASYQANLQSQENQRQEQWNADEWTRQFGMQEQQWQQHFSQETAWNSEQAKAQRLREVGVNPVAALGGSQSGAVSTSSTAAPSVSPRSGVTSAPAPFSSSTPQILNSLNDAIATMGKVGLQDAERNRINKLLEHEINKTIAETDNEKEQAVMNRLANMMTKEQWPYKVQMGVVELYDKIQGIYLKQSQSKNYDADTFLKDAQREYTTFLKTHGQKLEPWQVGLAEKEFEWYSKLKAEEIRTMRSQQELNTAESGEAKESARSLRFENDMNDEQRQYIIDGIQLDVARKKYEKRIAKENALQAEIATDMLNFEKDVQVLNYIKGCIYEALEKGVDVASVVAKMKSAKAFETMSEAQKKKVDAYVDDLENNVSQEIEHVRQPNGTYKASKVHQVGRVRRDRANRLYR